MPYFRWLVLAVVDYLLHITLLVVPAVLAAFTRAEPYRDTDEPYSWGGWYGTYDNPPQGDENFVEEACLFPGEVTGLKGYLNRVHWMYRNPLYGYQRKVGIPYSPDIEVVYTGNPNISDKYRTPGWYLARAYKGKRLLAFELYVVWPWSKDRCLRARLGWKLMTDKFQRYGFAQLVDTVNPFKRYGKKE